MAFINRNPFAREETHRETVPANGQTCAWCGSVRKSDTLYQYRTETDSGRQHADTKLFCCLSCRKAYNGE